LLFKNKHIEFTLFCLLCFQINIHSQTTFSKHFLNLTDSISKNIVGWGTGVQFLNNKIYNYNFTWDSTGPSIGEYSSMMKMDDTGKIEKQWYFREDSMQQAGYTMRCSNFIKTLDGGLAAASIYSIRYFTGGTISPNSYALIQKFDEGGELEFSTKYRNILWTNDTIVVVPELLAQTIDSGFVVSGYLHFKRPNEFIFLARFSKLGVLLWDTFFTAGLNSINFSRGLWSQKNIIKLSVSADGYFTPTPPFSTKLYYDYEWYRNHIYTFDNNGSMLNHYVFPQKSMAGSKAFGRYNDEYSTFFGASDTLCNYNCANYNNYYVPVFSVTSSLGLIDNQHRIKWRYIIPMDTIYYAGGPSSRFQIPVGSLRLNNGDIIWFGSRDVIQFDSLYNQKVGFWILKTDSLGNRKWDRVYEDKNTLTANYLMYASAACEADNGDIIITGTNYSSPQFVVTMRVDSNGMMSPTDSGLVGTDIYGNTPYLSLLQTFNYPNAIIEVGPLGKYELKVFPNPASSNLYLMFNVHEAGFIRILDINGRELYKKSISIMNNQMEIDISNLNAGNYFLECSTPKNRMVQQWVKK
jgi:hypothetical protein